MTNKRRSFGAAFKAKVAPAASKGDLTTSLLASEFGDHTSQMTACKKQLMDQLPDLFTEGRKRLPDDASPGLEVDLRRPLASRSSLAKDRLVQLSISEKSLEADILLLKVLQPLGLIRPQAAQHSLPMNARASAQSHPVAEKHQRPSSLKAYALQPSEASL